MSDTPTTRAKAKMAKDRDANGRDARYIDAFRLDIIEAFKDPSVSEQMAAAFAPHLERKQIKCLRGWMLKSKS